MDNKSVANLFDELAKLMELNGENPFKIRSYQSAYQTIRSLEQPILEMSPQAISEIKGIGKAISSKIEEVKENFTFETLEKNRSNVPFGILEMLGVKGLGVKKIRAFWKDLNLESPEEVLDAALDNKLIVVKGISEKTQLKIANQLQLFIDSRGKKLGAEAQSLAQIFIERFDDLFPDNSLILTGELSAHYPVVDRIEFVSDLSIIALKDFIIGVCKIDELNEDNNSISFFDGIVYCFYLCSSENLHRSSFIRSSSEKLVKEIEQIIEIPSFKDESTWMKNQGWSYLVPELRYNVENFHLAKENYNFNLIEEKDIRGLVHFHTKYSDGLNSLDEMIGAAVERGYEYAVVTDHSKSAFYASGLDEKRIINQFDEIDIVQLKYPNIKILKSIESDILNNGSLDYADEMLQQFDLVIASVHSNLNMSEDKAMKRLITAIENPYTHILGHMTSRLLLMREGYPIDHKILIDACSANNVTIELNANPRRMDIDFRWIKYAMEKEVMISINPDAHFIDGIDDIKFGVQVARRGGLSKDYCLNALPMDQFMKKLQK